MGVQREQRPPRGAGERRGREAESRTGKEGGAGEIEGEEDDIP